ncbi:ABC transporter permease [Actinoplanes sp. OR16]|uniref:carbohydrate ABC transporter permease n=1 Tax=Actinoplanes sp. OR16 TaxID=946334 RepID=UPI000F6C12CB|nr:sugar ABC transporter permease [Actinoplanes sp. OR16]BBH68468.1 ABC transporter permease [Actinoplanes sp. OR16]
MTSVRGAPSRKVIDSDPSTAVQPVEKEGWLGAQPIGMLFVLPYVIFLAAIFVYPLFVQVVISFKDYFFAAPGATVDRPWVGLQNYADVLQDPTFQRSLLNVLEFMVINVPATVVLSLVLAYALNSKIRGLWFFRGSYYAPYVTASVAIVTVWLFMFGETGLVNTVLGALAPDPSWLINKYWAMPMIAIFVTWKQLGFFILLYLAALQNVPKETYEAADVDGAGTFRKFMSVTVPGVRPATTLVVILATITGMNLFTEPYLLTNGGGPNGASVTPVFYMYQKGVEQGQAGYAAAIGMILLVITLGIALVQRRLLERRS